MKNNPLIFKLKIAKNKPSTFRKDKNNVCPFCDVEHLTDIYKQKEEMIWLHNRYPTLTDTLQTVLIESDDHNGDITTYDKNKNRKLIAFARDCYWETEKTERFQSVLWYKNYGPKSSGSLIHPHMQIVGLEKEDGYKYIQANNFEGITVLKKENIEVNFSTHPIQGYQEINVNILDNGETDLWADWIQISAQYVLEKMYNGRTDSYNLFFYPRFEGEGFCCKIIPRFYASPYFVGYKLSQCNDNETLKQEVKKLNEFALEKMGE
ncbi:DUF4931 domain-containing protein [Lactobacillus sp. PV012]|uniref:DUF4931 domain-containing protein n=1 Tax=Lactobacillus sp. PV012 TaxID=2594494 RepID=UPI0022405A78|nr:DUF4931 domain-containing protein [Lactobacillus sp. PV012]QNQ82828.1 DUF4931 domain-containing protein [Lactobacillus sp. PV012]